jgi:hypothetical protein
VGITRILYSDGAKHCSWSQACVCITVHELTFIVIDCLTEDIIVLLRLISTQYEGVSKSFRTGRLERELQMAQLSASRCSCTTILWVSLVSFAAIILCVVSQRGFNFVYFVIDSVQKLLDTPSYLPARVQNDNNIIISYNSDNSAYHLLGRSIIRHEARCVWMYFKMSQGVPDTSKTLIFVTAIV